MGISGTEDRFFRVLFLSALALGIVVGFPLNLVACQSSKTVFKIITPSKKKLPKTTMLNEWLEVPIPECEFWIHSNHKYSFKYNWELEKTAKGIAVAWNKRDAVPDMSDFSKPRESIVLPTLGFKMYYDSGSPMVRVVTKDGPREVPRAAFDHFEKEGAFLASDMYGCAPDPLFFYSYSGEPPYEVEGPEAKEIFKTGEVIWGTSGEMGYMFPGRLVRIHKNRSGKWISSLHTEFVGPLYGTLRLNSESVLFVVGGGWEDRRPQTLLMVLSSKGVETVATIPVKTHRKTNVLKDDLGNFYFMSNKGVVKISNYDSWLRSDSVLFVPSKAMFNTTEEDRISAERACRTNTEIFIDDVVKLATKGGRTFYYFWLLILTTGGALVFGGIIIRRWAKNRNHRS